MKEMTLPAELIQSLNETAGFNKSAFIAVHVSGQQITSVRINPARSRFYRNENTDGSMTAQLTASPASYDDLHQILRHDAQTGVSRIPWTQYGYYLPARPSFTFDPLFHAGAYYVQEASSMFVEQALKQLTDLSQPLRVLDLCGAPGGKSTHLQSLISRESLLVSNEVIRSRANVLKDNIIKWGSNNVVVTNNDPSHFSKLEDYFDVIVADAPCSGSGLFRRDPEAIHEWSENNVALCSQRQQRILADSWPCLKKNGLLIYSTCSYSEQEDEAIVDWMTNELQATIEPLSIPASWGIIASGGGYRFWPDQVKGEGFFLACLRKTTGGDQPFIKIKNKPDQATKSELNVLEKWVQTEGLHFIKHEETVYGWPEPLVNDLNWLLKQLRVIYSGTVIGEFMRDKLVPAHALAMSNLVAESIGRVPLTYDHAIQYLQRKDFKPASAKTGWQMVTYEGYSLGWVNVLPNRINNYYPKELRILKEQ